MRLSGIRPVMPGLENLREEQRKAILEAVRERAKREYSVLPHCPHVFGNTPNTNGSPREEIFLCAELVGAIHIADAAIMARDKDYKHLVIPRVRTMYGMTAKQIDLYTGEMLQRAEYVLSNLPMRYGILLRDRWWLFGLESLEYPSKPILLKLLPDVEYHRRLFAGFGWGCSGLCCNKPDHFEEDRTLFSPGYKHLRKILDGN